VHALLRARHPGLLTIVVPRHPERAEAIVKTLAAQGLKVVRRSLGEPVRSDTDILLGDTIGEMGLYLRLTEIAFVGRSLTAEGGQNPIERHAQHGRAAGLNVNFPRSHRLIDSGGASGQSDRTCWLAQNFCSQPAVPTFRCRGATVEEMRGALDRTIRALDPFIQPLMVKSRLRNGSHP
jgi:3-deoxy-D-manno-octulosonic-acid transferase